MTAQLVKVSDLVRDGVLRVEDGNHGEYRPRPHEFEADGVPFIRAADMSSGVVDFRGAGRINAVAVARIRKGIGLPGDVLLSHKGTVGKVAVAPNDSPPYVCSPQTTFWRSLDPSRLDQRYLRNVMASQAFRAQLDVLKGQTDMAPYVSLTDQRTMVLPIPDIKEQRAIAEVLGALDDKIAANLTVADTALRLAEAKFLDARRLGAISERTFGDMADVSGGGTPRTSVDEYWNGVVMWATPTDVTALAGPFIRATARRITEQGLAACSSALHPAGSILMTSRATIGAFAVAQVPMAVNQGFIVVNTKGDVPQWWLFHEMRSRVDEFISHANGATFLELSRGKFKQFSVHLSDAQVMERFADSAEALHATGSAVLSENDVLARTRDELLPLLMSGTVRVKDAEKVVEGVV